MIVYSEVKEGSRVIRMALHPFTTTNNPGTYPFRVLYSTKDMPEAKWHSSAWGINDKYFDLTEEEAILCLIEGEKDFEQWQRDLGIVYPDFGTIED